MGQLMSLQDEIRAARDALANHPPADLPSRYRASFVRGVRALAQALHRDERPDSLGSVSHGDTLRAVWALIAVQGDMAFVLGVMALAAALIPKEDLRRSREAQEIVRIANKRLGERHYARSFNI